MTDGIIGIDTWGGRAVFGLHALAALVMVGFGANSVVNGNLGGAFAVAIGVMLLIVGRSAGRIAARR